MGLDQYAYKTKLKPSKPVDFQDEVYMANENNENSSEEFMYWRKHPNLHGFMEQLYREKGGESDFNCRPVELTQEDIDRLAASIVDQELPETRGFFFGESDGSEYNQDLDFCKQATEAIKEGYTVFYDSWW